MTVIAGNLGVITKDGSMLISSFPIDNFMQMLDTIEGWVLADPPVPYGITLILTSTRFYTLNEWAEEKRIGFRLCFDNADVMPGWIPRADMIGFIEQIRAKIKTTRYDGVGLVYGEVGEGSGISWSVVPIDMTTSWIGEVESVEQE